MKLSWLDIDLGVQRMADYWARVPQITSVCGIPTGGCFVAVMLAHRLDVPLLHAPAAQGTLVVDDLIDSGRTLEPFKNKNFIDVLFRKPHSPLSFFTPTAHTVEGWIEFPWEHDGGPFDALVRLLQFLNWPNKSIEDDALRGLVRLGTPEGRELVHRLVADLSVRGIP